MSLRKKLISDDENFDEKDFLNEGEEDQMEVEGFRKCLPYQILSWMGIVLSFGLLGLIYFWFPKLHLWFTHKHCSLSKADKVLITDRFEKYKEYYVKNVYHGVIFENSNRERNYAYTNQSYESDKGFPGNFEVKFNSIRVHFSTGYSTEISEYRLFKVKKLRYIWVEEKGKFLKLSGLGPGLTHSQLHDYKRLTSHLQQHLQQLYGRNEILINVQSYLTLLIIEIASPYYFFQLFSIVVWIVDSYFYYTYAIIFVSILSIAITVIQTHRAQLSLRKTVQASEAIKANILTSDGRSVESKYTDLVPGDRIVIPDNEEYTLPCDALILNGSCIVRESMLTGESVPLTKTALPVSNEHYIERESSNHLLFCGTKVIQTRRDQGMHVQALVLRTGFTTAKGDLVRAILYPPPVDYEFEQSIYSFINMSAVGAFALAVGVAIWLGVKGAPGLQVFTKSFELVTMVIPAAIPGSLTLSKVYAIQRFKKKNIACINPKVINVAGSSNCVCFDKTGTITEDGLDVWGVVPVENSEFLEANNSPHTLRNDHLKYALATCHSLSVSNDKIIGDPLDSKMFESTGWTYEESYEDTANLPNNNTPRVYPNILDKHKLTISLLHQNQFMSNLQRMSIITQRCGNNFLDLYCKGSPEMIASLSKPNSVPTNLDEILKGYTMKGYRVLALGWRQLDHYPLDILKKKPRNEVEKDLQFLGLLILENKVKSESRPTIDVLKKGQFKITMITGDNIQTAISVSRECDIISSDEQLIEIDEQDEQLICRVSKSEQSASIKQKNPKSIEEGFSMKPYKLALTGKAWEIARKKYSEFVPHVLVTTAVFARMTSKQKQQVVTDLQSLDYCVIMCGDGANDCAALKASNVGVSLSQAEASVASPLSSAREDISCIPVVIREGRASLTAAFGLIKFILCYGYVQLASALISYGSNSNLSDFEFIWEDIFVTILFSLFFSLTSAYEKELTPQTPIKKMIHFVPILSIILHMIIFIFFQLLSYFWIQYFPWYVDGPIEKNLKQPDEFMIYYSYKNYAVFSISIFQVIMGGVIFSQSHPYRKPLYTNYMYLISVVIIVISTIFIIFHPTLWVQQLFVLALPPLEYRYITLALIIINFIICYVLEKLFIEYFISKKCLPLVQEKKPSKWQKVGKKCSDMSWLSQMVDAYSFVDYKQKVTITDYFPAYRE